MIPLGVLASAHVTAVGASYYVSDTFNRADNASSLGTADTGQTWTTVQGTAGISSNQARAYANLTDAVIDVGTKDMRVSVDIPTAAFYLRLFARYVDDNNYIAIFNAGKSDARAFKKIGGTEAALAPPFDNSTGRLSLECFETGSATRVRMFVDGTQIYSVDVTDTGRPQGTKGGMRLGAISQTARWDNFEIEEVTA